MFAWWISNLSCELFRLIYPRRYLRLRYEDLVRSPKATLQNLLATLLPEIPPNIGEIGMSDNRHQLYGNSIRFRQLSLSDLQEDLKWKTEMPVEYSRIVLPLSYFLRVRYGYA